MKPNKERRFLSYSKKLFLSVISLFLIFAGCFMAYQYQREKEYKIELLDVQLQDCNERLHREICQLPDSLWPQAIEGYIVRYIDADLRVTIIDRNGMFSEFTMPTYVKITDEPYADPDYGKEAR